MLFLIISVVAINAVALVIPKKLSMHEIWSTCLFAIVLNLLVDLYLDRKYGMYGYFSHNQIDWLSLIPILGLYPATSTIFLNFYPIRASLLNEARYIVAWSVFSLLFEFISVRVGYFYYNGWVLWYSALCYPVLLYILVCHLRLVQHMLRRDGDSVRSNH